MRGFGNWPIRRKMLALVLLASTLPLAVTSVLQIRRSRRALRETSLAVLDARADQLRDDLDDFHESLARAAKRFAASADGIREPLDKLFARLESPDPRIAATAVVDTQQRVVSATKLSLVGSSFAGAPWLAAPGGITTLPGLGDVVPFVAPLREGGAVVIFASVEPIRRTIAEARGHAGPGSFALLFDAKGHAIAGSPEPIAQVVVTRALRSTPWTLSWVVPAATLDEPERELVRESALGGLFAIALALGGGMLFASFIVAPLHALIGAADASGKGDLSVRVRLRRRDELGRLAFAFNTMLDALSEVQHGLEEQVRQRTSALEQRNDELRQHADELLAQRQELERQRVDLERKNVEVERADRLKSEFLANMSHELRTPLNSVIGFSELLLEEELPQHCRRPVENILTSGRHLLALINDILDLAKIEAGRLELERRPLRLGMVVDGALALVRPQAMQKSLQLSSAVPADVMAFADEGKLRQILLNLLSNAIKFSHDGGRIEVSGGREGNAVWCAVRDEGIGLDEALIARLFEPFVQGESALVKKHQGTGLGLAISKKLVERHGGHIEVVSAPGKGATFRFTLRAADSAPERPQRMEVLIVDDDSLVHDVLRDLLTAEGYEVLGAATGAEGLRVAAERVPRVALIDLVLPDLSGFEVLAKLPDETRPIVLTARDLDLSERARLREKGVPLAEKGDLTREALVAAVERAARGGKAPEIAGAPLVLVVDDHDLNRELVRTLLERRGLRVALAQDGEEGLQLARAEKPAIVLLDLAMPGKDGFETARELRADAALRAVPLVALTALASRADEARALEAGFDAYVPKPIERGALEAVVDKLVAERKIGA